MVYSTCECAESNCFVVRSNLQVENLNLFHNVDYLWFRGVVEFPLRWTLFFGTLVVHIIEVHSETLLGEMKPIFCGNFDYEARQSDLERLFGRYGRVTRVDMKSGNVLPILL